MNMPTQSQLIAFGRHVITFGAGAITLFAALKLISAGDAAQLQTALDQLSDGAAKIMTALTTLIGISSGLFAAWKASPWSQILAVGNMAKDPSSPVQAVITTNSPEGVKLAASVPSEVVVPAGSETAVALAADGH